MRKRLFACALTLALALVLALGLGGCGQTTTTLEDFMDDNPTVASDFQKKLDKAFGKRFDAKAEFTGDTLTLNVTLKKQVSKPSRKLMKKSLNKNIGDLEKTMTELIQGLGQQTEITGITSDVTFYDQKGKIIWSHTFE